MAKARKKRKSSKRRRHDRIAILLRIIIVLLLAFIIGMIVWFALHDRDVRSGVNALKKGNYDEAISCFDTSIAAGEDVAESHRGKGLAYYEQKKYKEAAEELITSVDKGAEPTAQVCSLIVNCLMQQEQYEESLEWLQKGLEAEGLSYEMKKQMRYQTIICYEKTAQWEQAKECAQEYIADYPEDDKMDREYKFLESR